MKMRGNRFIGKLVVAFMIFGISAAAFADLPSFYKFAAGEKKTTAELGVTSADIAVGGWRSGTVAATDITLSAAGAGGIYGGSFAYTSDSTAGVTGGTKVTLMTGTVDGLVIGGGYAFSGHLNDGIAYYGDSAPVGSVNITMGGDAAVNTSLIGGGCVYGTMRKVGTSGCSAPVSGDVNITISGGSIPTTAHLAIAGGGNAHGCHNFEADAAVNGNTNILISGGTFGNGNNLVHIVGGGAGEHFGASNVLGNTNITVEGGTFKNIALVGGGMVQMNRTHSNANVAGNTTITFSGNKALASAEGISEIIGGGVNYGSIVDGVPYASADVAGTKNLIFNAVGKGSVSAEIKDFDVIVLQGNDTELTFTKALSDDVKKIKVIGTFKSDTAVLTLAANSFKPAVDTTGTAAEWNGMKLIVKGTTKEEPAKPAEPVFDDETQKILSGDVETLAPSVPVTTAAAAALLTETGLTASDMDTDGAGQPILKSEAVQKANTTVQTVYALPIFSAALPAGTTAKIVSCAFEVTGDKLLAATPEAVKLIKVQGAEKSVFFNYSADPADFKTDGTFTIQNAANAIVAATETISADAKYKVTVFIEDNGAYDLDATAGRIVDPSALVTTSAAPEPSGSGSSGGCSSGAFALAALFGCAIVVLKGKK